MEECSDWRRNFIWRRNVLTQKKNVLTQRRMFWLKKNDLILRRMFQHKEGMFQPKEGMFWLKEGMFQPKEEILQPKEGMFQTIEGMLRTKEEMLVPMFWPKGRLFHHCWNPGFVDEIPQGIYEKLYGSLFQIMVRIHCRHPKLHPESEKPLPPAPFLHNSNHQDPMFLMRSLTS